MKDRDREKGKYTTSRDEPLTGKITIRVTQTTQDKVKAIPDYAEKLRVLIQEWLDNLEQE